MKKKIKTENFERFYDIEDVFLREGNIVHSIYGYWSFIFLPIFSQFVIFLKVAEVTFWKRKKTQQV